MIIEEKINKQTIEEIDKQIQECVKGTSKIENGNYILGMLLKDIKDRKVNNIVEVAQWCFDKINIGKNVEYVLTKSSKDDNINI